MYASDEKDGGEDGEGEAEVERGRTDQRQKIKTGAERSAERRRRREVRR